MNIQPSEAWKLDLVEIMKLSDAKEISNQDTSLTINAQRIQNGAPKEWLQNLL